MSNQEHLKIFKQGVDVWNKCREENLEVEPDLTPANLISANLIRFDLIGANLKKAVIKNIILENRILVKANLTKIEIEDSDMVGATCMGRVVQLINFCYEYLILPES